MINDYVLDLSQIEIIKTLGSGGCGEVFLVKNKDGKQFAAKTIKNDQNKQDMQIEFYREIESFAKTKYPA